MSIAHTLVLASLFAAAPAAVDLGGLKSVPPASWKEVPVTSPMRLKQFTVPGKKGEAELVVFFFGQGQGGSSQANIDRWKQQFQPPAGKSLDDVTKVTTTKIGTAAKAITLDISGTYLFKASPMSPGPAEPRPDHRMLAVDLTTPKGDYFIKLVGPAATVEQNKKPFETWLKSFK
jgi:hypothetical protein